MGRWDDHRKGLDAILMETNFEQLRLVFDEFKKINEGKSIVDAFTLQFGDDADKLTIYKQLGKTNKMMRTLSYIYNYPICISYS